MDILFQDKSLIVVNKPGGLPVQPDKTADTSLYDAVKAHCNLDVQAVHRIDRPASGVVLFGKREKSIVDLNLQFQQRNVDKTYLAVVKNKPAKEEATLTHYIRKNQKSNRSFAFDKELHHTKKAVMSYKLLGSITNYHLLEVKLETGRHHQIRVQLAAIGCPIKGDVKYGFKRGNTDRSIHLHAWKLDFWHPIERKKLNMIAPPPTGDSIWKACGEFIQ